MTNTIKWHFEGIDVYFLSTEDNFERHKLQNAGRLGLTDPNIIIIEHGNTNNPITTGAPCRNCNSSTENKPTLPVGNKKTKTTEQTPDGLFYLSGDVDPTPAPTDPVEDQPDLELLGGSLDRLAL
jgi:hypothetical protein